MSSTPTGKKRGDLPPSVLIKGRKGTKGIRVFPRVEFEAWLRRQIVPKIRSVSLNPDAPKHNAPAIGGAA